MANRTPIKILVSGLDLNKSTVLSERFSVAIIRIENDTAEKPETKLVTSRMTRFYEPQAGRGNV